MLLNILFVLMLTISSQKMFSPVLRTLCKFVSLPLTTELNQIFHKCDPFPSVHPSVTKSRLVLTAAS